MTDSPTLQFPSPPGQAQPGGRNGWRVALIAALTTLVLVLPVAVYLLMRHDGGGSAEPGAPVPSTSSTAVPSSGPVTAAPSARPPDGHITLSTLKNATLTIPRWPADNVQGPYGKLRFRDGTVAVRPGQTTTGQPPTGIEVVIIAVTYGDVDRDGVDETIAEIGCLIEGGSKQLVAFDRDSNGQIITMGTVVATTGAVREIRDDSARVDSSGIVTARLADFQRCCADETPQMWQTRGYRWRSGRFEQATGPTTMPANPAVTETTVSTRELTLGPVVEGYRYGTFSLTVAHRWGTRPAHILLRFFPSGGLERAGSSWPPVTTERNAFTVTLAAPPAKGSITLTCAFRRPATSTGGHLTVEAYGLSAGGSELAEAVPFDNGADVQINVVD